MLEERLLQKEITHKYSKMQIHRTETGEKTPEQFKYIVNMKLARIQDYLNQLEEHPEQTSIKKPTPDNIVCAVRHLTEYCISQKMVLWFDIKQSHFMDRLSALSLTMVDDFDARQSAVMIWMYGKIGRHAFTSPQAQNATRELLGRFVAQLLKKKQCQKMQLHDVMLLINGLANLNCTQLPEVLNACLPTFRMELAALPPAIFPLFIWSYGKLGFKCIDTALQMQIMQQCDARFKKMSVQQISSIAWGLCRMEMPQADAFLDRCAEHFKRLIGEFVPIGISRFMDACFMLNHYPGDNILKMMCNRFSHFRSYATPAFCFQALPAFAYFVHFPKGMYGYSYQAMRERYTSLMESDQMVRILASYSLADTISMSFLDMTMTKLVEDKAYGHLPPALLRELWIGIATHKIHKRGIVEQSVPEKLMQLAEDAWMQAEAKRIPHKITPQLHSLFKQMQIPTDVAFCDPETKIHADLLCEWDAQKVALLVVDQPHVFRNEPRRLNGHFLWRERMFLKMGYGTGRIDIKRWDMIERASTKRQYLERVLQSHLYVHQDESGRDMLGRIQDVNLDSL